MAGPWEDFQQAAPPKGGPWEDFQPAAPPSGGMFQGIANWWKSQPSWLEQAAAIHKASNPNSIRPTDAEIDFASGMAGAAPIAGRAAAAFATHPITPTEVALSAGQRTGDLALHQEEQAARLGQRGDLARERAAQFDAQQAQEVQGVKERIGQSFDQFGQTVAQSPQDAAAMAQGAIQRAAQNAKAGVKAGYDQAKQAGGQIDAGALPTMGGQVRATLSARADPVIVDEKLTPWASKALSEIDSLGDAQNRAAMPGTGMSLESVEQTRKRLVQMRSGAYANNPTDGRAASAVLDAFDDHIGNAFTGNPQAMRAWNDARAASAQFKQTFSAVKGDPVGQKIEKIIGRRGADPLTPNDVADALYGVSGTNPGTTNVGVAVRVRNILGDQSPEWSAVKQGLWQRITEKAAGVPEMEPGTISKRLFTFLNGDGRDMANAVYSPQEREMMKRFAELQRQLQPPAGALNRSNTSTFVAPLLKKIDNNMTSYLGFAMAQGLGLGPLGEVLGGMVTGAAKDFVTNRLTARKLSAQMPLATEALEKWHKAVAAYDKANSPPSRVALSTATMNLSRAFKPLGITFDGVLPTTGSTPAAADEKNP